MISDQRAIIRSFNDIHATREHMDSILEPACVVPLSILQKYYLKSNTIISSDINNKQYEYNDW